MYSVVMLVIYQEKTLLGGPRGPPPLCWRQCALSTFGPSHFSELLFRALFHATKQNEEPQLSLD